MKDKVTLWTPAKRTADKIFTSFTHLPCLYGLLMTVWTWAIVLIHFHMSSSQTRNKDTKTDPTLLHTAQIQSESHRLVSDQIKKESAHIQLLTYLKDISPHTKTTASAWEEYFITSPAWHNRMDNGYVKAQTSKELVHSVKAPALVLFW